MSICIKHFYENFRNVTNQDKDIENQRRFIGWGNKAKPCSIHNIENDQKVSWNFRNYPYYKSVVLSNEERKLKLARVLAVEANNGWRVESQTEYTAVLYYGKGGKINHILHLLLSLITFGIWLIVWIIIGLSNQRKTKVIAVEENGEIIVDFGTIRKFANSEKDRIPFPMYKKKSFWILLAISILFIVSVLQNAFEGPTKIEAKVQPSPNKDIIERSLTVYDIENAGFYDDEIGKYVWGASFKVKYISQNVKILCTTDALDGAGKVIATQTGTYNTLANPDDSEIGTAQTVLYGADSFLPSISKLKYEQMKEFKVKCSYFD